MHILELIRIAERIRREYGDSARVAAMVLDPGYMRSFAIGVPLTNEQVSDAAELIQRHWDASDLVDDGIDQLIRDAIDEVRGECPK